MNQMEEPKMLVRFLNPLPRYGGCGGMWRAGRQKGGGTLGRSHSLFNVQCTHYELFCLEGKYYCSVRSMLMHISRSKPGQAFTKKNKILLVLITLSVDDVPVIGQKDKCETPQKSMPVYDTSGGGVYWAELFPQYPIYLCQLIQTRHIMLNRPKGKPPISDQKLGFWRNQPDWRAKIQTFFSENPTWGVPLQGPERDRIFRTPLVSFNGQHR